MVRYRFTIGLLAASLASLAISYIVFITLLVDGHFNMKNYLILEAIFPLYLGITVGWVFKYLE